MNESFDREAIRSRIGHLEDYRKNDSIRMTELTSKLNRIQDQFINLDILMSRPKTDATPRDKICICNRC